MIDLPFQCFSYNQHQGSPYIISIPMQARTVMLRRVQMLKGNVLVTGMILLCV